MSPPRRPCPAFVPVDAAETFTLPAKRGVMPLACIRLGRACGGWVYSTEAQSPGFGGHGGPLGYSVGLPVHVSRSEALAAAVAEIERRCGDAPDKFRAQLTWAGGLLASGSGRAPAQPDLFAA